MRRVKSRVFVFAVPCCLAAVLCDQPRSSRVLYLLWNSCFCTWLLHRHCFLPRPQPGPSSLSSRCRHRVHWHPRHFPELRLRQTKTAIPRSERQRLVCSVQIKQSKRKLMMERKRSQVNKSVFRSVSLRRAFSLFFSASISFSIALFVFREFCDLGSHCSITLRVL